MKNPDKMGSCMNEPENENALCSCCQDEAPADAPKCECPAHPVVCTATDTITFANQLDHFLARWGVNRMGHTVEPGLYRLGSPDPGSPVFASANYTLSFDALRSALAGTDCYILVLDTKGINVWCAAGKGTFGTDELVRRIDTTGLGGIVRHRKIILPQLAAPGVSWPEVLRGSGFRVEYGPVRARDLPEYLRTGKATPEMRRVRFPIEDRIVLTPVEFVHVALPMAIAAIILYFLAGLPAALAAIAAVLGGTVLFPALLPFIPTRDFSTKGLILGIILALPFAFSYAMPATPPGLTDYLSAAAALLVIPAVVAYLALNFTGCTTFTSRTGVKKEIFRYVPTIVLLAATGVILGIIAGISRLTGVI